MPTNTQIRRNAGRFFGRRVNCEQVPLLPAYVVREVLDDPRKIPYLLVWRSPHDGGIREAARIAPHHERPGLGGLDWSGVFEIKRHDGTRNFIRTLLRPLPRNGGRVRLLICLYCQIPRRGLYGWEAGGEFTNSAQKSSWECRRCGGLRYSSEGGALVMRGGPISRLIGYAVPDLPSPRPEPWLPYVFASPMDAADAGFARLSESRNSF
jgi:hypothetical protein